MYFNLISLTTLFLSSNNSKLNIHSWIFIKSYLQYPIHALFFINVVLYNCSSCHRSLYPHSLYQHVYTRHPMKNLLGINAEGPLGHCFGRLGVWGHLDIFHLIHTCEQTTHIFVGTDHFYLGVLYQTKRTYIYKYTCTYVHLMKVCFYVLCLWDKV